MGVFPRQGGLSEGDFRIIYLVSLGMLKIQNTGSHTIVWTHENAAPLIGTASKSILLPEKRRSESSLNVDRFCIELFSALEQTRCVLVACDST